MRKLFSILKTIDGKGYKAYKELKGKYDYKSFLVEIFKVQGDPFAPPSIIKLVLKNHGYEKEIYQKNKIPVEDFIYRKLFKLTKELSERMGSGNGGIFSLPYPTQAVFRRSAVKLKDDLLVVSFFLGLPAYGRKIAGDRARKIFEIKIPKLAEELKLKESEEERLSASINLWIEQEFIRKELKKRNLVAFVGNGSLLPRESGQSDKPLKGGVKFFSPESFEVKFELPTGKTVSGMGIPEGITLITGGGFHGKTTLLSAIQNGIYNHILEDGREYVITKEDALKIVSEDGRFVRGVDISNFITELPQGKRTDKFSTDNASGSTSMASSISEAIEAGIKLFLIDEDKTATNFMIKDERMEALIEKEPIMPFVERISEMKERFGISTIIVAGGAGEYLNVADRVILMEDFLPKDVMDKVEKLKIIKENKREYPEFKLPNERFVELLSLSPYSSKGKSIKKIKEGTIFYGENKVYINSFEQIKSNEQMITAMSILDEAYRLNKGKNKVKICDLFLIFKDLKEKLLATETPHFFYVREIEVIMLLNRLKKLRIM